MAEQIFFALLSAGILHTCTHWSASLGLADYSQVDTLKLCLKFVNFRAWNNLVSPNW